MRAATKLWTNSRAACGLVGLPRASSGQRTGSPISRGLSGPAARAGRAAAGNPDRGWRRVRRWAVRPAGCRSPPAAVARRSAAAGPGPPAARPGPLRPARPARLSSPPGRRLRQADQGSPAFHGRGGSHARCAGRRLGLRDAGLRRIDRGARTHRHRRLFPGQGLQQLRPRGCGERQRLAGQPTGYLHRAQEGAATLFFDQISGTGN